MRRTDKKNAGPTRRGVAAALERALGFLERMRLLGRRGRAAREKKEPSRAQKRQAAKRIILKTEISRLEKEIDRVHAHIVQGAGNLRRNPANAPALPDLVRRARDLREQLCTKRVELSRLERDIARELRLQQTAQPETAAGRRQKREPASLKLPWRQHPEIRSKSLPERKEKSTKATSIG